MANADSVGNDRASGAAPNVELLRREAHPGHVFANQAAENATLYRHLLARKVDLEPIIEVRCGSKAVPDNIPAPLGSIFITSLSPTFSAVTPDLIQVLIAHTAPPHGSICTRATPSPRDQNP